jgi:hypothetical protein
MWPHRRHRWNVPALLVSVVASHGPSSRPQGGNNARNRSSCTGRLGKVLLAVIVVARDAPLESGSDFGYTRFCENLV